MQKEYFHYFIGAEAVEVFSDRSSNADTENSDRSKLAGVRSYVTNEYARLLRSREDVLENAISHHHRAVEEYYCCTEDWWHVYNQGLFGAKGLCKRCDGSVQKMSQDELGHVIDNYMDIRSYELLLICIEFSSVFRLILNSVGLQISV